MHANMHPPSSASCTLIWQRACEPVGDGAVATVQRSQRACKAQHVAHYACLLLCIIRSVRD